MIIKGTDLKKLVSEDLEFHNAMIEGLNYIFTDGWSDELVNVWNEFQQLLSFNKDLDSYSYDTFIYVINEMKEVYLRDWGEEASGYIQMLGLSIIELTLYKKCLVSGLSLELGKTLQDVFDVVEMKAVGGAE